MRARAFYILVARGCGMCYFGDVVYITFAGRSYGYAEGDWCDEGGAC